MRLGAWRIEPSAPSQRLRQLCQGLLYFYLGVGKRTRMMNYDLGSFRPALFENIGWGNSILAAPT